MSDPVPVRTVWEAEEVETAATNSPRAFYTALTSLAEGP